MGNKNSSNSSTEDYQVAELTVMVPQVFYKIDFKVDTPRPTNAFEQVVLDVCYLLPAEKEERMLFDIFDEDLCLPDAVAFIKPILQSMERNGLLKRQPKTRDWSEVRLSDLLLNDIGRQSQRNQKFPQEPIDQEWKLKQDFRTGKISTVSKLPKSTEEQGLFIELPEDPEENFQESWFLGELSSRRKNLKWWKEDTQILGVTSTHSIVYTSQKIPLFLKKNGFVEAGTKDLRIWENCEQEEVLYELERTPLWQTDAILDYSNLKEQAEKIVEQNVLEKRFQDRRNGRIIRYDLYQRLKPKHPSKWSIVFGALENTIYWDENKKKVEIYTTRNLPDSIIYGDSGMFWSYSGIQGMLSEQRAVVYSFIQQRKQQSVLDIVTLLNLEYLLQSDWLAYGCFCSDIKVLEDWILSQDWSLIEMVEAVDKIEKTRASFKIAMLQFTRLKESVLQFRLKEFSTEDTFDWEIILKLKEKDLLRQESIRKTAQDMVDSFAPIPNDLEELRVLKKQYKGIFGLEVSSPSRLYPDVLVQMICEDIGTDEFLIDLLEINGEERKTLSNFHLALKKWNETEEAILSQKLELFTVLQNVESFGDDSLIWKICKEKCQPIFKGKAQFEHLFSVKDYPYASRSRFVIFDTSTLVERPDLLNRISTLSNHYLTLPMRVLAELDLIKDDKNKDETILKNARQAIRFCDSKSEKIKYIDSAPNLLDEDRRTDKSDDLILSSTLRFVALRQQVDFISEDKNLRNRISAEGFQTYSGEEYSKHLDSQRPKKKKGKKK